MTALSPPFSQAFDLGDLGRGAADVRIAAHGDQLAKIAAWAGVPAVETFGAEVHLTRKSATRFSLDAELVADIVQECVVTLDPVRTHIERPVHRELHLVEPMRLKAHEVVPLTAGAGDDDVPEEIETLHYDIAAPLLEELLLAIDPYPRAPGVAFVTQEDAAADKPESPFAVLKALKQAR